MIVRASTQFLICVFLAAPALADEYVCSDFQHVSRETIGFVAKRQGLDWNSVDYRDTDFESALNSNGGMFFLFAGRNPSDRFAECLAIAEQLTPRTDEAFKAAVSRLGKNSSSEIMSSWPEEMRDEYKEAYFPVFSVGRTLVSGSWNTTVFATMLDEPERSLSAIDLILGQLSKCEMSKECRGAFAEFVGKN